jgi:hypothetical protein
MCDFNEMIRYETRFPKPFPARAPRVFLAALNICRYGDPGRKKRAER